MTQRGIRQGTPLEETYFEIVPSERKLIDESESSEQPLPEPYYPKINDCGTEIDPLVEDNNADRE